MKAAELVAARQFRVVEQAIPEPGPGEVQVRVAAVGICGSDMHNFIEGGIGDTPCRFPMILGHEPSGTLVKTGAGVTGFEPGDRFAFEPGLPCGKCEYCARGLANLCDENRFMSSGGVPGYFREFVTIPAANLVPIPRHVGLAEATLIEPLGIALHSMSFVRVQPGETAVVFGAGPIGLMTIAALKLAGVRRIWAVEPLAHRREMARVIGADVVLDKENAVSTVLHDTSRRGVDLAFDCAATEDTLNQSIACLAKAGRFVYTGIPSATYVPLYAPAPRKKEISLFNVFRSNHQGEHARDILADHLSLFAPVVTHSRPIDRIQDAFEMTISYAEGVGKTVVEPSAP
jgi:L-iditol 2-dehydrogenase